MSAGSPEEDRLDPALLRALDVELAAEQPGDADLLARVKGRVLVAIGQSAQPGEVVRAGAGDWQPVAPRIERKVLWSDGVQGAYLLRCAPGAALAPHLHAVDEECLVLEGSIRIGDDLVLCAGDFHRARKGSLHDSARTDTGALLYMRGSPLS